MRKLTLDTLEIESFETTPAEGAAGRGTVHGHVTGDYCNSYGGDLDQCAFTKGDEYCQDTAGCTPYYTIYLPCRVSTGCPGGDF